MGLDRQWLVHIIAILLCSDEDQETVPVADTYPPVAVVDQSDNSEMEIPVRSLALVFIRPAYQIVRSKVSSAHFIVPKFSHKIHQIGGQKWVPFFRYNHHKVIECPHSCVAFHLLEMNGMMLGSVIYRRGGLPVLEQQNVGAAV